MFLGLTRRERVDVRDTLIGVVRRGALMADQVESCRLNHVPPTILAAKERDDENEIGRCASDAMKAL